MHQEKVITYINQCLFCNKSATIFYRNDFIRHDVFAFGIKIEMFFCNECLRKKAFDGFENALDVSNALDKSECIEFFGIEIKITDWYMVFNHLCYKNQVIGKINELTKGIYLYIDYNKFCQINCGNHILNTLPEYKDFLFIDQTGFPFYI